MTDEPSISASSEDGLVLASGDPSALEAMLVRNHRRFVQFVTRKLGDASAAEELVQSALVKALERGTGGLDDEGIVNWFYRVLQNAIIDHHRRRAVEDRVIAHGVEAADRGEDPELKSTVCACMHDLLPALKPEYADIVRRVDLEERPVSAVAAESGITANNASVRLHRARHALKSQLQRSCGACAAHGCLDCSCKRSGR